MGVYAHSQVFWLRYTRQTLRVTFPDCHQPLVAVSPEPSSELGHPLAGVLVARLGSEGDRPALAEREVNLDDLVILGS